MASGLPLILARNGAARRVGISLGQVTSVCLCVMAEFGLHRNQSKADIEARSDTHKNLTVDTHMGAIDGVDCADPNTYERDRE